MASIFSRIVNGEIPSWKVAEDENYYAFLDINPLAKGHTLVIPKLEEDYIFNLPAETYTGLWEFARKVAKAIDIAVPSKRVGVAVLGMEVPHAHIHLVPMQSEGDMDFRKEKLSLTPDTFKEIAEKIGINDTITVKEDASIYYTQYDATEKTNALDPVHEREMERNVIGATVKMPDGSLQFTQNNEMLDSLVNNGGEITSYLTGNEHEAEGFWNVNDINKVNQMNQEMGGMTR